MAAPPRSRVERSVRRLGPRALRRFVADLWRARGFEVTNRGEGLFDVQRGPGDATRLAVTTRRWRGIGSPSVPGGPAVDTVVTGQSSEKASDIARRRGADLLDAGDLADAALHALDAASREALLDDHLRRAGGELAPADPPHARLGRRLAALGPTGTPALLLVLALLAGGVAVGVGLDDGTADRAGVETAEGSPEAIDSRSSTVTPEPSSPRRPSIDASGVHDPDAVTRRHYQYLRNTSYTVGVRRLLTGENGTLQEVRIRVEIAPQGGRYHYVLTESTDQGFPRSAPSPRIEFWYDGDRTLVQYTRANGSTVHAKVDDPDPGGPLQNPSDSRRIGSLLTAFRTNVTVTGPSPPVAGPTFRVRGVSLERRMLFSANGFGPYQVAGDTQNATFEAVVGANGVVRTYRVGFNGTYENRTVRATRAVDFTRLGRTTVDRPDWYRAANESE